MAISFDELIEKSEISEEIIKEIAGVKNLQWDMFNFEKNVNSIMNKMDVMLKYINEYMRAFAELESKEKDVVEALEKEGDFSEDPWFKLYAGQRDKMNLLFNIIAYLSVMNEVMQRTVESLNNLVLEAKKIGVEKQKIDTEIDILKSIRDNFKDIVNDLKVNYKETLKDYNSELIRVVKSLTPSHVEELMMKIQEVKNKMVAIDERIDNLNERLNQIESMSKKSYESESKSEPEIEEKEEDLALKDIKYV